jgi:2-C-methyl-D-erythritol 4-phosphate cytidylyltransferase
MKITAIIPAAGTGSRYDRYKNKLLENLDGIPVIVRTLRTISSINSLNNIIICTSEDLLPEITSIVKEYNITAAEVIIGGETRQESVFKGLNAAKEFEPDFILIHDGARPLISKDIIENAIKCASIKGAAIVAVPTKDTIKRVDINTNRIIETINREELWNIQTPQIFKYQDLLDAHNMFENMNLTDDSALIEKANLPAYVVLGSYSNIKITTKEDLLYAEMLLKRESNITGII